TWVDRSGKTIGTVGPTMSVRGLDLAHDGKRVAVHQHETDGGDVWIVDPARGATTRMTFDVAQHHVSPVWSPHDSRIAFAAPRNGVFGIYQKASNGAADEERLLESKDLAVPTSWSPDGRFIVYTSVGATSDIWLLPLTGDR